MDGQMPSNLSRDRILDEGLTLMLEGGLRRTSAAELARRLGVVQSALNYHFPGGKREIVEAVFDRIASGAIEALERAIVDPSNTRAKLVAIMKAKLAHVLEITQRHRVREPIADELGGYFFGRLRGYMQQERKLIARVIHEGIERGEIREIDADLVVSALQGALYEVARAFSLGSTKKAERVIDPLVDLIFRGIGASP